MNDQHKAVVAHIRTLTTALDSARENGDRDAFVRLVKQISAFTNRARNSMRIERAETINLSLLLEGK